jgi:hypothetical protein
MKSYTFNFSDSEQKEIFINLVKNMEGKLNIKIDTPDQLRSSAENRYYFGVVIKMIADETGNTDFDIHNEMKAMFCLDTTRLTIESFEIYCEKIRIWALNFLNLKIPLPREII